MWGYPREVAASFLVTKRVWSCCKSSFATLIIITRLPFICPKPVPDLLFMLNALTIINLKRLLIVEDNYYDFIRTGCQIILGKIKNTAD